jgi:nicotinamidase-related amidase
MHLTGATNEMPITIPDPSNLAVLIIDVQPFFLDVAFPADAAGRESLLTRLEQLLLLADWFDLPVLATAEHPVDHHGALAPRLARVFPSAGQQFTKRTYDCCREPAIRAALEGLPAQVAVTGAETDVCVLQSVLGLLRMDRQVFLLEDCLFTTEPHPGPALRRMIAAGAIPSTFKSLAYELTVSVDHTPWLDTWVDCDRPDAKPLSPLFRDPESLPPWRPVL